MTSSDILNVKLLAACSRPYRFDFIKGVFTKRVKASAAVKDKENKTTIAETSSTHSKRNRREENSPLAERCTQSGYTKKEKVFQKLSLKNFVENVPCTSQLYIRHRAPLLQFVAEREENVSR